MKKIYILLIIVIFLFSCFQKKYKLGLITNLEGPNSAAAIEAVNSVKLCYQVYKENTKNPIDLEIITLDDSWNPEKTKKAYSIMKENSNIIIFGSTSEVFMSVYNDVIKDDKILGFIVAGISEISNVDDNIIRTIMDTEKEQKSIANFLIKRNPKKILIIQENERNEKYTEQSLKNFLTYYNKDYDIVKFSANVLDLKEIVEKVKNNKYQYAYFVAGGTPREVAIVIQNIRKIDEDIICLTLPWVSDKVMLSSLGEKQNNIITTSVYILDETNSKYVKFVNDFKEKVGGDKSPSTLSAIVYDQTSILIETFSKIKTDNAKKVKKYILANEFEGVTGKIKFNKFGDCERDLYFFEIKNGEKKLIN
ncbi:MAG TPA: ABC transporter substrate-binding protein [Spirochaetota bacterium]|nr:ABC transporter substrate-binding protein [Spirochaetota bacterium]HOL57723.1 ABC transporter substrate-binding protein [Spirochaetota bacterium]HPP05357.1 ABC transporter substrate-binding protein [Spirochaetota bacterium]